MGHTCGGAWLPRRNGAATASLWRQVLPLEGWGGSERDLDFLGCRVFVSKALPVSKAA